MTMLRQSGHRPAMTWLTDLQRAKAEGNTGIKVKMSIQDLIDANGRINDPNAPEDQLIPSSPRSVEACFRLGIDPVDLRFRPPEFYKRPEDADPDVSQLRYERNEAVRQERLRALMDERKHLVDEGWAPQAKAKATTLKREDSTKNTSTLVEKEKQRLEVMKRRQERELEQMVHHEVTRKELLDKQQKRVEEMERRNAELVRQRQENEHQRMVKQRDIELQKAAEEREMERQARIMAEERYRHEKNLQQRRAEEERELKRKAYKEEMERRAKAEQARRETEAILEAQAEEVARRKAEMERRDVERVKRLAEEAKAKAIANTEKRKKADARIMSALTQNTELLIKRRSAFEQKEAEAAERRRQMDEIRAREEARKREEERLKELERHEKYQAAVNADAQRRANIKARAEEKDRMLAELYAQRKKEMDMKKVEREFHLTMRLDKVDAIQKTNLYGRQQLLEKIMGEYDKTRSIMQERQSLQEQRKRANMTASLQRQAMAQVMDQVRFKGGSTSVHDLMQRARPQTAM